MDFQDTKGVINELIPLFETNKELQLIENIIATKKDIERSCLVQNQQLQALVNQQLHANIEAEKAAVRSEPESEHKKRMTKMTRALQDLELSIQEMENMNKELVRNAEAKTIEKDSVTTERKAEENTLKEEARLAGGLLQLWQHVAHGLKWDLSSNGRRGYLISKKDSCTKTFENPETPTPESINRMWAMLENELDVN
jgi:ribonuclease D